MDMPKNKLKQALLAGQTQIGVFLGLADPYSAEIVAGTGFDFLLIDAEHGPNDTRTVLSQLQAMAPYGAAPFNSHAMVRPPKGDTVLIKQYLDIGVQSLLVPMIESAEQAEEMVRAVRYPPVGVRGVGTALARAARWNGVDGYFKQADGEMFLMLQIESVKGLENLEAIANVEGVDGVFIGPSDLAASMGYLGQPGHPEVKAAVENAIDRIAATGRIPGVFTADPEIAKVYKSKGARFLIVGVDTLLLRNAAVKLAASFKTEADAKAGASY